MAKQYIACLDPISERQGQEEYSLSPEMYGRFLIELFELWDLDLRQENSPISASLKIMSDFTGTVPGIVRAAGRLQLPEYRGGGRGVYPCDFMYSTSIGSEI